MIFPKKAANPFIEMITDFLICAVAMGSWEELCMQHTFVQGVIYPASNILVGSLIGL